MGSSSSRPCKQTASGCGRRTASAPPPPYEKGGYDAPRSISSGSSSEGSDGYSSAIPPQAAPADKLAERSAMRAEKAKRKAEKRAKKALKRAQKAETNATRTTVKSAKRAEKQAYKAQVKAETAALRARDAAIVATQYASSPQRLESPPQELIVKKSIPVESPIPVTRESWPSKSRPPLLSNCSKSKSYKSCGNDKRSDRPLPALPPPPLPNFATLPPALPPRRQSSGTASPSPIPSPNGHQKTNLEASYASGPLHPTPESPLARERQKSDLEIAYRDLVINRVSSDTE